MSRRFESDEAWEPPPRDFGSDSFARDDLRTVPPEDPLDGHTGGAWGLAYGTNDMWGNTWSATEAGWDKPTEQHERAPVICQAAVGPGKSWRQEHQAGYDPTAYDRAKDHYQSQAATQAPAQATSTFPSALGETWEDGPASWARA